MKFSDQDFANNLRVARRWAFWTFFIVFYALYIRRIWVRAENPSYHLIEKIILALACITGIFWALLMGVRRLSTWLRKYSGAPDNPSAPDLLSLFETVLIFALIFDIFEFFPKGNWSAICYGASLSLAGLFCGSLAFGNYDTLRQSFQEWGVGLLMSVLMLVCLLDGQSYRELLSYFGTSWDFFELFIFMPLGLALIFNGLVFNVLSLYSKPIWAWCLSSLAFMLFAVRPDSSWPLSWESFFRCLAVTAIGFVGLFLASQARNQQISSPHSH
jgi:hypothetical protein